MLNKIKMFTVKVRDNYYVTMYQYWTDEAEGFIKLGRYDEAERCCDLAVKYLIKETNLLAKSMGLA